MTRSVSLQHTSARSSPADGVRVLVDRRWPAGRRKDDVSADLWLKEIAPSDALLRWYGRDRKRWPEFVRRYRRELLGQSDMLLLLLELWNRGPITLLHCGRDSAHDPAAVIRELLEEQRLATHASFRHPSDGVRVRSVRDLERPSP